MDKAFTFKDIFTKTFWDSFNIISGELTFLRFILTLGFTLIIGLMIFIIYRITYRGVLYNRNFNVSLVVIALVSSLILMVVSSNLILSLGMVGALSIVRFRTAVKDPLDTVFMFWAISAGIVMGADIKFWWVGILGSVVIGGIICFISFVKIKNGGTYLLVLHYTAASEERVQVVVDALPRCRLKAKTVSGDGVDMTLEIRLKDSSTTITREFMDIEGVRDVSLISQSEQF